MSEWLTVAEAARYLRVSRGTVYALSASGQLPYYTIAGLRGRRFKREDLEKLLERGSGGQPELLERQRGDERPER